MFNNEILFLTLGQITFWLAVVAAWYLFMNLIVRVGLDLSVRFAKRKTASGQTYLYSKASDTDFFDQITEFRNDIAR